MEPRILRDMHAAAAAAPVEKVLLGVARAELEAFVARREARHVRCDRRAGPQEQHSALRRAQGAVPAHDRKCRESRRLQPQQAAHLPDRASARCEAPSVIVCVTEQIL